LLLCDTAEYSAIHEEYMGTQQLLLIVIGVVIVAAAVATGITIFNNHEFTANRQAILADMQDMTVRINEFWKLPKSLGGAGQSMSTTDVIDLANYLGFSSGDSKVVHEYYYSSPNGSLYLRSFNDYQIYMEALGNSCKNGQFPYATMNFSLVTQKKVIELSRAKQFSNGIGHPSENGQGHGPGGNSGGNGGGNDGGNGDDDDGNGGGNGGGNSGGNSGGGG